MRNDELPIKLWCQQQAKRDGLNRKTVHKRFLQGKYPWVHERHDGERKIFITDPLRQRTPQDQLSSKQKTQVRL